MYFLSNLVLASIAVAHWPREQEQDSSFISDVANKFVSKEDILQVVNALGTLEALQKINAFEYQANK